MVKAASQGRVPESQVVQEVKTVIQLTGLKIQRINSGAVQSGNRYIRLAAKGTLDFEGYDNKGRFVGIECKRPVGGRVSPEQQERIDDINQKGGVAFVARSGQEALDKLRENGCIK